MKKIIFIIIYVLLYNVCYSQSKKSNIELESIKKSVIGFLQWYKIDLESVNPKAINDTLKSPKSIIVWKYIDTLMKPTIDMVAVEEFLKSFKNSNTVSESFINNLRQYHKKIAEKLDAAIPYPKSDGKIAIPGLDLDVVFGFEPEVILDHIKEGEFTKICTISGKSIVKFDISNLNQYIFTLSKIDGKWLIDSFGFDRTNYDKIYK